MFFPLLFLLLLCLVIALLSLQSHGPGDGFRPGLPYPEDKALWEASLTRERSPVRFITSGGRGPDLLSLPVTEVVLNCAASVNSLEH